MSKLPHDILIITNDILPSFALKECAVFAGEFAEDAKPTGMIIDNYCKTPEFNHLVFKDDCKFSLRNFHKFITQL